MEGLVATHENGCNRCPAIFTGNHREWGSGIDGWICLSHQPPFKLVYSSFEMFSKKNPRNSSYLLENKVSWNNIAFSLAA